MTDLLSVFDVLIDAVVPVACIFGIGYLSGIFRVFVKQHVIKKVDKEPFVEELDNKINTQLLDLNREVAKQREASIA